MNEKNGINEIKYRVAMVKLNYLLEQKLITDDEYKKIQKTIIRKYKPIIGVLDVD